MKNVEKSSKSADPFDLNRFLSAQETSYDRAHSELLREKKQSHWMWFIFPQIDGLGSSNTTRYYSIKSLEEARAYLAHPILGARLLECTEAVLDIEGRTMTEVFGYPDDLKLRSAMTLFAAVSESGSAYSRVLDRFFDGKQDERTLRLLDELPKSGSAG